MGDRTSAAAACRPPAPRWRRSRTHPPATRRSCSCGTTSASRWATSSRVSSLMSVVHPDAAVMEAAEGFQIEARTFCTDLHLDADVFAQLSSLDAAPLEAGARRVLERRPARLPALRGRPRRGDPGAGARAQPSRERAVPDVLARHPRRAAYDAGAGRPRSTGLPEDYVAEHPAVDGHGRDQHRVPRHAAVPDPRPRPRAAPPRSRTPSSTSAGRRTTPCSPSCSRCARRRPPCSGTPTGRATTPRSR